jgi:hypothetical protein
MKDGMRAYQHSETPVAKSQEDIRRILAKYGADGVQFSEDWKAMLLFVRFLYTLGKIQHSVVFRVPIPKAESVSPGGRYRSPSARQKLQEQYERGIWRAVFWAIKSRMESVDFGIETFQEAFLSHFEVPGSDKQIGEFLIPRLETGTLRMLESA